MMLARRLLGQRPAGLPGLARPFCSKAYTNRKYGEKVPPRNRTLPFSSPQEKSGALPEFLTGEFEDKRL